MASEASGAAAAGVTPGDHPPPMDLSGAHAGDPSAVHPEVYNWAADQVYRLAREHGAQPEGFWENAQAFAAAVDWTERWIQGLVAFHALLWLTVLLCRKNMTVQSCVFLLACALVAVSEPLNTLLREKYWSAFARQNYFDERGAFAVVMFTGPLVLLALLQLFIFLKAAADLLVKVKRAELQRKQQKEKKKQ